MTDFGWVSGGAAVLAALGALAASSTHAVRADQRLVEFRLGELAAVKGPGPALVLPGVERAVRVPLAEPPRAPSRMRLPPDPTGRTT